MRPQQKLGINGMYNGLPCVVDEASMRPQQKLGINWDSHLKPYESSGLQ